MRKNTDSTVFDFESILSSAPVSQEGCSFETFFSALSSQWWVTLAGLREERERAD